jgi:hypothetical protein
MFLPSLLEYSTESLAFKIQKIKQDLPRFFRLTKQKNKIHLHLDIVSRNFAKDKKVMESLELESVFGVLEKNFKPESLELSIHLMSDSEDLMAIYKFLEKYEIPYSHQIFIDPKYLQSFKNSNPWYDLESWFGGIDENYQNFLIMTVFAGKSGQVLTSEIQAKSLELIKKHPDKSFILDGGWQLDFNNDYSNLQIVTYSSFWKQFLD